MIILFRGIAVGLVGLSLSVTAQRQSIHAPPKRVRLSSETVRVPFDQSTRYIGIDVKVAGKGPYRFNLDTGAGSQLVIDPKLSKELGLRQVGTAMSGDGSPGGSMRRRLVHVATVEFGGVRFEGITALEEDFSWVERSDGKSVMGLLGFGLFQRLLLKIDYPRGEIVLCKGELAKPKKGGVQRFFSRDHIPYLAVHTGDKRVRAVLDTGAQAGLTVKMSAAALSLVSSRPELVARGRTIRGVFDIYGAQLRGSLVIGGHRVERPRVSLVDRFEEPVIGYGILKRFAVTFDQKTQRVLFEVPEVVTALHDDVVFDRAVDSDLKVYRAASGHLFVRPRIDGVELGWFMFDTGASVNVIDLDLAREKLELKHVGVSVTKSQVGSVESPILRAKTMQLGPATFDGPMFSAMDMSYASKQMPIDVVGILGCPVLHRAVVEYEIARGVIRILDPSDYELENGSWRRLLVHRERPHIDAEFEGHRGVFLIDSGSFGAATFYQPAVERYGLLRGRKTRGLQTAGVRGQVVHRQGLIKSFEVAGRSFGPSEVLFVQTRTGSMAVDYPDGHIGCLSLKPFRLVFDYPNRRIGFVSIE